MQHAIGSRLDALDDGDLGELIPPGATPEAIHKVKGAFLKQAKKMAAKKVNQ